MATPTRTKRYRGVRQREWGSWVSEIRHPTSKTRVWLGTFGSAKEAAKAYDEAVRMMKGPNAKTNFPLLSSSYSSSSSSTSPCASLLSPSVRAKLQRCNCMAILQGASKYKWSAALAKESSNLVNATKTASTQSRACVTKQGHQKSLVCLRLDDSQDQVGVTLQASRDSKPEWVTILHIQAASHGNSAVEQASMYDTHTRKLIPSQEHPSLQSHDHGGELPISNCSASASAHSIIYTSELEYITAQAHAPDSCSTSHPSPDDDQYDAVCSSIPFHHDALALPASLWYLEPDDLAAANSFHNGASLTALCDQLYTYPLFDPASDAYTDLFESFSEF